MGEVARTLAAEGIKKFFLGGGLTGDVDDRLLRFNLYLSDLTSIFRLGGAIFDPQYHRLNTQAPDRFLHYRKHNDL